MKGTEDRLKSMVKGWKSCTIKFQGCWCWGNGRTELLHRKVPGSLVWCNGQKDQEWETKKDHGRNNRLIAENG